MGQIGPLSSYSKNHLLYYCRFRPNLHTREVAVRRGREFEEKIGVKREWIHPWRNSKKTQQPAYYDIVVQELGKNISYNNLKQIYQPLIMIVRESEIFIYFLERRVIYDYEKYGDSPVCLGEIGKDGKSGQIGVSEVECAKI